MNSVAAFILTNGRPDNVRTYRSLRRCGFTGRIVLVVDSLDDSLPRYREAYGDEVEVFDKPLQASLTDRADNFPGLGTVLFARNACYDIAERLGIEYFVQLDDDYSHFAYRFNKDHIYQPSTIRSLDAIFAALVAFVKTTPFHCVCMAQGGDFMGGEDGRNARAPRLLRKAMNSFVCVTSRPIDFVGRLNDDVNTYVVRGAVGALMCTTTQVSLLQAPTQAQAGGLTEAYLDAGTYVKSFYTVMMAPSAVSVSELGSKSQRLHHRIEWRSAVPKIVSEDHKKTSVSCGAEVRRASMDRAPGALDG